MLVKDNKKRVNIMLEEEQRQFISKYARESKMSISEILRELIEEKRKEHKTLKLTTAAEALAEDYIQDEELTAFTALDGEEPV